MSYVGVCPSCGLFAPSSARWRCPGCGWSPEPDPFPGDAGLTEVHAALRAEVRAERSRNALRAAELRVEREQDYQEWPAASSVTAWQWSRDLPWWSVLLVPVAAVVALVLGLAFGLTMIIRMVRR